MRFPLPGVIALFILSFLTDWLIYSDIRKYAKRPVWRRIYAVSAVACWIFLIVILLMPKRESESNLNNIMWMLYTYLSIYIPKTIYCLCSIIGMIPMLFKRKRWKSGLWVGVPLAFLTFITMWWGVLVTRHEIQVNEVEIASPRVPKGFDGYRIVQFSDAHVGTWGNDTAFISTLVDSVNALKPNLIVFTGDVVNRQTNELAPFLKVFSRLKAPDGVISVLGNHDYGDYIDWAVPEEKTVNRALMESWQKQIGWDLVNNDRRLITHEGDTLVMIGVENWGEPPFKQYGKLFNAYPLNPDSNYNLTDDRFKILLSHNPEHWNQEVTKVSNIDLTLSGHTHAMQMMVQLGDWKWSPAKYRYEQWAGMYERPGVGGVPSRLYVNIGVGEVAIPFRIGATPEITVFTLRHGSDDKSGK